MSNRTGGAARLLFVFGLLAVLFALPTASATPTVVDAGTSCQANGFLSIQATPFVSVQQGTAAVYTFTLHNQDSVARQADVNAVCDPDVFSCGFTDANSPLVLSAGQTLVAHLRVDTGRTQVGSYAVPVAVSIPSLECSDTAQLNLNVTSAPTPTPGASATPTPFDVTVTPAQFTGQPGDVFDFDVVVNNPLPQTAYASFLVSSNPFSQSTRFSADTLTLKANETKTVRGEIEIPPGTPGSTYNLLLTVRAQTNNQYYDTSFPLSLFVFAPTVVLSVEGSSFLGRCPAASFLKPYDERVGIRNAGYASTSSGPFSFEVEASDEVQSMLSVNPSFFSVNPGDRQFMYVHVQPPATARLDTYHYAIVGKQGSTVVLRQDRCFTVDASAATRIQHPDSIQLLRGQSANAFMQLTNVGGAQDAYTVDFTPQPTLGLSVTPSNFTLNPAKSQNVKLSFATTLATPLTDYALAFTVRSTQSGAQSIRIPLSVWSSNQSDQSYLHIRFNVDNAVTSGNSGCQYGAPACAANEECVANACRAKTGCQYNNPSCPAGRTCKNNECVVNPTPTPVPKEPAANAVIVMDSSESMAQLVDGQTKLAIDKKFVTDFASYVQTMRVGLRAFGSHPYADRAVGCQDSNLLVPVSTGTKDALKNAVGTLTPQGLSPVKLAVSDAADDLALTTGTKMVVIVSDGLDSCLNPPDKLCDVATKLKTNGITAYAIGFNADAEGKAQLQCIVQATNGKYYDARNGNDFLTVLNSIFSLQSSPARTTNSLSSATAMPNELQFDDSVTLPVLPVVDGQDKTFLVRVESTSPNPLLGVTLKVLGVPDSWVTVDAPRDLAGLGKADYHVTLHPDHPSASQYNLQFWAYAGRESVTEPAVLAILPQQANLDFSSPSNEQTDAANGQYSFAVNIRNTGNTRLDNIRPALLGTTTPGLTVTSDPDTLSLQPGESQTVHIRITMEGNAAAPAQPASLAFATDAGVVTQKTVQLPALQSQATAETNAYFKNNAYKFGIVFILVIIIFALLAKQDEPTARDGKKRLGH